MNSNTWGEIVNEARRRFEKDVEAIIDADGSDDQAVRTLKMVKSVVKLFADQLGLVGLERLP